MKITHGKGKEFKKLPPINAGAAGSGQWVPYFFIPCITDTPIVSNCFFLKQSELGHTLRSLRTHVCEPTTSPEAYDTVLLVDFAVPSIGQLNYSPSVRLSSHLHAYLQKMLLRLRSILSSSTVVSYATEMSSRMLLYSSVLQEGFWTIL